MKTLSVSAWIISMVVALPATTWAGAGDLDHTFGSGGIVHQAGLIGELRGLVLLPDGKLVAAGGTTDAAHTGPYTLARYNTDGSLDTTFGSGGWATTGVTGAVSLVRQPDGKLVGLGMESVPAPDPTAPWVSYFQVSEVPRFALSRWNADGSLDTTFGDGGTVIPTAIMDMDEPSSLVLQPDGKLLAVGRTEYTTRVLGSLVWRSRVAVVRCNSDGSLDQSFGTHGSLTTDLAENADTAGVAVRGDGTILVGATSENDDGFTDFHFVLIRYLANGQLDSSFGTGGIIQSVPGSMGAMRLLSNGKIVAAGQLSGGAAFALVRHNADGSLDSSFGNQGVTLPIGIPAAPFALRERSDGSVLAAGFSKQRSLLVQFTEAGTLDPLFGSGGIVITPGMTGAMTVVIQPDNKVVAGGGGWALARYLDGVCGNGTLEAGEECDDGNLTNGDGCDANCTATRCGNGVTSPGEACDDGNQNDRDGCKNDCTLNVCGDGVVFTGVEACDDGNTIDDDGCSNSCQRTECGNGTVAPSEECDDGNTVSGDGCDTNCFIEHCGNGRVEANEQCDNGTGADDGRCGADCHWSVAYDAVLEPVRSMGLSLQPDQDEATYSQMFFVHSATTSILDRGVLPPDFHANQLIVDEGDCPPGTIVASPQPPTFTSSLRGWVQVTVHVTRAAFPLATQDTPQSCTLHFTVRTVPEDVWDQSLQNNSITVPFGVWAAGVSAGAPTSFMLQTVKPQHVTIRRRAAATKRHVRVALTTESPNPKRTIAVTMQDGSCPPGTVVNTNSVSVPLKRRRTAVSVPLTFRSDAFRTPSRTSPARCTPVVTAVDAGDVAGPHATQFDVDVTDRNDM